MEKLPPAAHDILVDEEHLRHFERTLLKAAFLQIISDPSAERNELVEQSQKVGNKKIQFSSYINPYTKIRECVICIKSTSSGSLGSLLELVQESWIEGVRADLTPTAIDYDGVVIEEDLSDDAREQLTRLADPETRKNLSYTLEDVLEFCISDGIASKQLVINRFLDDEKIDEMQVGDHYGEPDIGDDQDLSDTLAFLSQDLSSLTAEDMDTMKNALIKLGLVTKRSQKRYEEGLHV